MDFERAKQKFEEYLDGYDRADDKINLKIIHTYQVVECSGEIARRMKLSEEDTDLAKMIGLLHDIGRFEQLKRFNSFDPGMMNHAKYGAEILFRQGMVREFLEEDTWDDIIYMAIDRHSDFQLEGIEDERTLMHAKIIRDADKLDNCRVKLEEKLETLLEKPLDVPGQDVISDEVWRSCQEQKSILSESRKTSMDYWVSYVAYFYDINYKETMEIILENDYISQIIHRITYKNPETRAKMEILEQQILEYARRMTDDHI